MRKGTKVGGRTIYERRRKLHGVNNNHIGPKSTPIADAVRISESGDIRITEDAVNTRIARIL